MTCKQCGHFKPEPNQAYGYSGTICHCKKDNISTPKEPIISPIIRPVTEIELDKLKERIAFLEGKIEGLEEVVRRWHVAYTEQNHTLT